MFIRTLLLIIAFSTSVCMGNPEDTVIQLPDPHQVNSISLMEAITQRRSVRNFTAESITLAELSGILYAAQGITSENGFRAAPSAGATFPMTILVAVENVESLEPGIYRYSPGGNTLITVAEGSILNELADASHGQRCISSASAAIAIIADYGITTSVYGERGIMYVHMEAGHISQNVYLQCSALGLGTVAVGAFSDSDAANVLKLDDNETPLYLMPLGRP